MENSKGIIKIFTRWKHYIGGFAVGWTLFAIAFLVWDLIHYRKETLEQARIQARMAFERDIIYRQWNSKHGGVYVPVTKETQPNPYLSHIPERDITTPSGKLLTLINPAYMTRQVYELTKEGYDFVGHITSLNPIRHENSPDPWETKALQAFERGETEISSIEEMKGKIYMRLMRPLITEKACLICHEAQGYKEGDVRGGISLSIPMEPLWAIERKYLQRHMLPYVFGWLAGLIGIGLAGLQINKSERLRKREEELLNDALTETRKRQAEVSALLEASQAVLELHEFKDTARSIFDSCKNLLGASGGYVALLSEDGTENEVLFLDSGRLPCTVDPSLPMPIRGLREEAYRTNRAIYHNDFSNSEWVKFMPKGHVSLENVLFAPLIIEGKTVGLLGLANKPAGFTENDARLASAFSSLAAVALRNSRTFESLKNSKAEIAQLYERLKTERIEEQATLLRLSQEFLTILETKKIMECTVEVVAESLHTDCADVMLLDENGQTLTLGFSHGRERLIDNLRLTNTDDTFPGYIVQQKTPVIIEDLTKEDRFLVPSPIQECDVVSALGVPILSGQKAIGALIVDTRKHRHFSEEEVHFLSLIANQAGIALEKASLFHSLTERNRRLHRLYELAVSMAGDITRVADQVVSIIAELLDIEVALVERIENETIHTIAMYDNGRILHEGEFPLRCTPCERVKVEKQPCIFNQVAERFPEDPFLRERGLVAYIGIPVLDSQGEVIGVVNAMDDRPRDFSPDDLTLLYTLAHRIGIEVERAKAEKLVERRNKELAALYGITSTVSRSLDVDRILNDALDELLRLEPFKVEAGAKIFVLDMEKEMLTMAASHRMPTDHPCHKKPVKLGECLCGLAAKKGELIISETAHLDERHTRRWPNMPPHKDICLAIKHKDKVFGVLDIWLPATREVTEEEITLLEAIGNQIGVAIENARLFEEAQQRLRKLMAIDNIHHAIVSTLNMDEILSIFLENVIEISQADAATVMLMQPGSDILETIASRAEGGKSKATLKLKAGEGLAGWVARDNVPLAITDVQSDPRFLNKDLATKTGIVSYLGIPLKGKGKVIGVLNISTWHRREFTTEEVDFFTIMASEVAMAIENARLYGQIEKRAQELNRDLLGQKQYAENVLRSIADGVYTVDLNRVVLSWSKGAEVITGFKTEEAIGRACADFLRHTDEAGQVLCESGHCPFIRVWDSRKPVEPFQVFANHKEGGQSIPVAVTAAPIFSEDGTAVGAVEVFRDVSKEQELIKNLQEASRAKSEFLTKMSHELRTPLNSVIGFAQVLLRQHFGPLNDKQKEYLRDIYESGDHLLSLINDILDLSKVEVGKLTLGIKKIALGPKIERALVFVREKAMAHGISLETKISEDLPDVFADERAVLQILVNLLSNAVKFTPDGGRVEIKSYPQGDFVAVDVLDTGMGIAIEDQKKIFRLFEQLSVPSPYKREGTGLGLSIAQSLVTTMGGIITVKSELNKGSCFTFTLPIAKEDEEERSDENRKT